MFAASRFRNKFFTSAAVTVFGLASTGITANAADELALKFPDASVTSFYSTVTGTDAYNVTPITDIAIKSLCYYDRNGDGMTQNHEVALYDTTTQNQIVSTIVTSSSPLVDNFRCEPITPTLLNAGTTYQVGGYTEYDAALDWAYAVLNLGVSSSITYDGYVNSYNQNGLQYVVRNPINIFFFGPNFLITDEIGDGHTHGNGHGFGHTHGNGLGFGHVHGNSSGKGNNGR